MSGRAIAPERYRERFITKVKYGLAGDGEGCWEWQGARGNNGRGYGLVTPGKRRTHAHRYAWEWTTGPIPPGMDVCHHCDNPKCVRPSHLFLGTRSANMRDCISKGRRPHAYTKEK